MQASRKFRRFHNMAHSQFPIEMVEAGHLLWIHKDTIVVRSELA